MKDTSWIDREQGCEEEIILTFGLLLPKKDEVCCGTIPIPKAPCNLIGNRQLSGTCLPEENKSVVGIGIVHPFHDVVQKVDARSQKIVSLDVGAPTSLVWDFSDFFIKVYELVVRLMILGQSGPHTEI